MNDQGLNDTELDAALRTWMQEAPAGQPDRSRVVGDVVRQLGSTRRRRRRWWPVSVFRRTASSSTQETPERLPMSIPAANGHTPTVIGRTQTMFSPAKAIIAGALVVALGGVMLIAQPFDRPSSSVPGAATDDPAMAPSFFSGTIGSVWTAVAEDVRVERDDGVVENNGGGWAFDWIANDPRILGTATIISNETDYREGATMLAPTGDLGAVRTGLIRIANDGGSWEGEYTNLQIDNLVFDNAAGWLTGTGAYEGLSAYLDWDFGEYLGDGTFRGYITPSGPPPAPESLPG